MRVWLQRLAQTRRSLLAVGVVVLAAVVVAVVGWQHRVDVLLLLDSLARWLRLQGFAGVLVVATLLVVASFPPMLGYSTLLTLCGFVWGLPLGFVVAYIGALTGSCLCLVVSRRYLRLWVERRLLEQYPQVKAIKRVIERRGFRFLLLLRIAPYPYTVVNVLVATTRIPFRSYAAATAIALFKIIIHIYVGSSLTTFTDLVAPKVIDQPASIVPTLTPEQQAHQYRAHILIRVALGVGIVCGALGIFWVWRVVQRAVKDEEEIQLDELEEENAFITSPIIDVDNNNI